MYGSDIDIDGGWRYSAGGSFSEPRHAGYTCWIKRKPDPDEFDDEFYTETDDVEAEDDEEDEEETERY